MNGDSLGASIEDSAGELLQDPTSSTPSSLFDECMATAISIDRTEPHPSCECIESPELQVRFVSVKEHQHQHQHHHDASTGSSSSLSRAARKQEILIDYVGMLVSHQHVHFVMDDRFDFMLDAGHREFKQHMLNVLLQVKSTEACRSSPGLGNMVF